MEKAILKTLIYADIFDYPLTIFEIHKWLIGKKCNLRQVEGALKKLKDKGQVSRQRRGSPEAASIKGCYCLAKRKGLVKKRQEKLEVSKAYFRKAFVISQLLKVVPWIKLVGISGGLAMENAGKDDDIDLVIITDKNRMWICRLITLGILEITGQRRKASDSKKSSAGKICCNLILEIDQWEQKRKNIYTAHEVLQMKVLWQRDNTYHKFLSVNAWAFKFLPNWMDGSSARGPASSVSRRASSSLCSSGYASFAKRRDGPSSLSPPANWLENLAKRYQLRVMQTPKGQERIEEGALYFHPFDYGKEVLEKYRRQIKNFSTP